MSQPRLNDSRLTALLVGHERFVWRLQSRASTSNCEENLQLSLYTNKIFCRDPKWRYSRSCYSQTLMHVKDSDSSGTEENPSL